MMLGERSQLYHSPLAGSGSLSYRGCRPCDARKCIDSLASQCDLGRDEEAIYAAKQIRRCD